MHNHILTFIILPNVGYWKGKKITSKKLFSHTKKVLSAIMDKKYKIQYLLDGVLHRENDLPAVEYVNGDKWWYKNNKLHRDGDLPALICNDGEKWYKNGKLHREGDLPAIETSYGTKSWYKNGKLHRDGGLPAIIKVEFWVNGKKK